MKKLLALLLVLAFMFNLCGCSLQRISTLSQSSVSSESSVKTESESESSEESASSEAPVSPAPIQFSDIPGKTLAYLREDIQMTTALFGVMYIGYFDNASGIELQQWFESRVSPLLERYAFLEEIDEDHFIGTSTKGNLYCIVPTYTDSSLTVTREGEVLYSSEYSDPILLFANLSGHAQSRDTTVTLTTVDGMVCTWEPILDTAGFPETLVGDERTLLNYDFTLPLVEDSFDFDVWLSEGWSGLTGFGLAGEDGKSWWSSAWDDSTRYCLSFYTDAQDDTGGEVVLECFYDDDPTLQAEWKGRWHIETELEQPSRLQLDLEMTDGADMDAFEFLTVISEEYSLLAPPSGLCIMLVAEEYHTLPVFPPNVNAVELALAVG